MKRILIAILTLSLASCSRPLTDHVVLIGLDGMASAYFDRSELPNISALMDQGCWTLSKRSAFRSSSAINWASMFMGAGPELHGYTTWGSKTPEHPSRVLNGNGIFPTINSILREQRPGSEIGVVTEWPTIKWLVDSLATDYCVAIPDYRNNPELTTETVVSYIVEKKPTLLTVVYDQPDHVGHVKGWGTEEYHEIVRKYDEYVGRIVQAVKDAGIWKNTTIIVTADHGGIDKGHGGIRPAEYETPFVIAGKGIRRGGEFDQSMMQYDVASTIAALFALKQPQVWIGRPVDWCFK